MRKILTVEEIIKEIYLAGLSINTIDDLSYRFEELKSENEQLKKSYNQYQIGIFIAFIVSLFIAFIVN